jgi:hypothetical protein
MRKPKHGEYEGRVISATEDGYFFIRPTFEKRLRITARQALSMKDEIHISDLVWVRKSADPRRGVILSLVQKGAA